MKKILYSVLVAACLFMTEVAVANDLNTYRYIHPDGTVHELTDTDDYTEVGRETIEGKEYWVAVMFRPQDEYTDCLLYTSPSPRDISGSRMPSSA